MKCKQDGQQLDYSEQHTFLKRKQANSFEEKRRAVNGHNIVVQVDFAENYMAIDQDEIQSAHWNHSQVTLFTVCTWIDSDTTESSVIVSDDMIHDKLAVSCFPGKILENLKAKHPTTEKINLFLMVPAASLSKNTCSQTSRSSKRSVMFQSRGTSSQHRMAKEQLMELGVM